MSKCTSTSRIYEDMEFCEGKKTLPGIRSYVYAICKAYIVTWPKPLGTSQGSGTASMAGVAKITANFILAASATWKKIDIIPNDGHPSSENQGAYGSKTFKNTLEIQIPGTREEATGFIAQANNDNLVFLYVGRNGQARLIGDEGFDVELALSQDEGQTSTDTASTKITATVDSEYPAPFYEGNIVTSDGIISGKDGSAVSESGE